MGDKIRGPGWEIDSRDGQPWCWYIRLDGREVYLPCDPYSHRKHLRKGFRVKPKNDTKILKKEVN